MNVLPTDVKAPAAPTTKASPTTKAEPTSKAATTSNADKSSDNGENTFRSMMRENLQPESKNAIQVVENKEVNQFIDGSIVDAELSLEDSLTPDLWLKQYLGTSDVEEVITEVIPISQSVDEIAKDELLSNSVITTSSEVSVNIDLDVKSNIVIIPLPVAGESLPVNGNPLPLLVEQSRPIGPISNIGIKDLQQASQTNVIVQNITEGLNSNIATKNATKFDSSAQFMSSDLLDPLTAKTFELNALQQIASDSSSTRLQAAMSAINGMQNPSANPGTANPLASTAVLSNSLDRMVMTNPDSSAEWGSGLGERVSLMLNQKQNAATIRLDPPMLGKMDIQIQVKDDVTTVTINTQHAQTRDMVDGASHRLREILQDAGYLNVNVDVSHQSDQEKNDAQFMADSDSSDGSDSGSGFSADELPITAQITVSNSLVDYFA